MSVRPVWSCARGNASITSATSSVLRFVRALAVICPVARCSSVVTPAWACAAKSAQHYVESVVTKSGATKSLKIHLQRAVMMLGTFN